MTQRITLLTALLLGAFAAGEARAAVPATVNDEGLPSLAPLVEQVSPAVVNIRVRSTARQNPRFRRNDPLREFFGLPMPPQTPRQMVAAGSGVIVDAENGIIITNHHVVDGAEEISISLYDNDRTIEGEVVGSDEGTDIAVLKVDPGNLTALPFGDSDSLEVGDYVIAIGNPFGLRHTVTSGIVSALGRSNINNPQGYEDFIQTDASINPGNSGGALVNLRGELVGINAAIFSQTGGNIGIGFAIPANMARSIMRQILDFGEVRRGLLGVSISSLSGEVAETLGLDGVNGALVTAVSPDSAAEQAGIRVEDVITAVNGEEIESDRDLVNTIGLMRSGDEVTVTLLRDGRKRTVQATLGDRAAVSVADGGDIHRGLAGASFGSTATTGSGRGVEVTAVAPGSPAAQRGLQVGDVITEVNRRDVNNVRELREAAQDNNILFLRILRENRVLLLRIS